MATMDIKPGSAKSPKPTRSQRKPDAVIDEALEDQLDNQRDVKKLPKDKQRRWYKRLGWWWLVIILALIALGGAGAWWYILQAKPTAVKVNAYVAPPKPKVVADPLTGLPVTPEAAAQPVVGVMVENLDPNARPQSGLGQAGIVYEALAEGGITRFLSIYQEPFPATIGPVRSLRPYYLDWDLEYGIAIAHAGGSIPALAEVPTSGVEDINALASGTSFYRTSDRLAPHNLYTNAALLAQLLQTRGFAKAPTFTPLPRKADQPPKGVVPHPTISINFSYSDYAVQYRYDQPSNSYARWMAGTQHVDRNTGKQIYVKNVIVEYIPVSYSTQADGDPQTNYADVGSGKAIVFDDGNATTATWAKTTQSAQTTIDDANGKPIKLNAGNTWFEMVPTINTVTY
jgi:hypothetical protein